VTTLLIATANQGKLREIREILAGLRCEVRALDPTDGIAEPEETGATFEENARLKAIYYARATGLHAVADDSGLAIDALEGRPGVHSARYPGQTYDERFVNLWREIRASGRAGRSARFVCAIALASPEGVLFEARGVVDGEIIETPRGTHGFGYDPIFFYPPYGKTLAEVTGDEKSAVSHRGAAFRALRGFLER
jgi:XTP/dITP diphosphohydrolase